MTHEEGGPGGYSVPSHKRTVQPEGASGGMASSNPRVTFTPAFDALSENTTGDVKGEGAALWKA